LERPKNAYKIVGKPEGKRPLGRLRCDRKMTLEWILGKKVEKLWTGYIWLRIGTSDGLL
jgi:hypothetical protein